MRGGDQTGKRLEHLVAVLERILSGTAATVESQSRRLRDRDTGKVREHDVLITWDHGHHKILTAVECRDRSRPVGVPDVEAFADKCRATGVHSGVIVSAMGFRNSARTKAAARSITCMELSEAERFDWLAIGAILISDRPKFDHMHMRLMFEGAQPKSVGIVIDANGNELTSQQIVRAIGNALPETAFPSEAGKAKPISLHIEIPNWTMRDSDGKIWPIDHILVDADVIIERNVSPILLHRYAGGDKDYAIATADMQVGDTKYKLVMIRNDDDTTSVHLSRCTE